MDPNRFERATCAADQASVHVRVASAPPRLRHPCYAPVFEGSSRLECFFFTVLTILYLFVLVLLLILTLGSEGVMCAIRRALFRMQHCGVGNADPDIDLADPYQQHVHRYRGLYSKDAAWEQWMLDNRDRYEHVFRKAVDRPAPLVVAFRYDAAPVAYNPPWASETEHMQALETLNELIYAGYDLSFVFNGNTTTSYANAIAGIPTNASYAAENNVYLYYETIFAHEFGHVMGVFHHYDTPAEIETGKHMPPGETKCLMDRNRSEYCSACRTALDIPLDVDNAAATSAAGTVITMRYPY